MFELDKESGNLGTQIAPHRKSSLSQFRTNTLRFFSTLLQTRSGLANLLGQTFGGDRKNYDILGYKSSLQFADYQNKYNRQDIAGRIVDLPANSTWRNRPQVVEDESRENITDFETAWNQLVDKKRVLHYLERADRLSGIGRYGVLLIGLRGGGRLDLPAKNVTGGIDDLIYLAPFHEGHAEIFQLVEDTSDPRYGLPRFYELDVGQSLSKDQTTIRTKKVKVHYSRILHVAENLEENEIFGRPRLKRVFNLFEDLTKVVGGSAEVFWEVANRGMQMDIDPEMSLDPDDETNLQSEIDEYYHGLRRFIRTKGVDIKELGGKTVDNRGVFQSIMSLVAGAAGIPLRILIGSERGEMASTQDRMNWGERVKERQEFHAEPMILRPFVDKLMEIGVLPSVNEYKVMWPDLLAVGENERSQTASRYSRAIFDFSKAMDSQNGAVVSPEEFREKFLGLPAAPPTGALEENEGEANTVPSPSDG